MLIFVGYRKKDKKFLHGMWVYDTDDFTLETVDTFDVASSGLPVVGKVIMPNDGHAWFDVLAVLRIGFSAVHDGVAFAKAGGSSEGDRYVLCTDEDLRYDIVVGKKFIEGISLWAVNINGTDIVTYTHNPVVLYVRDKGLVAFVADRIKAVDLPMGIPYSFSKAKKELLFR